MQIRPTASAYGLIINFSIALFHVYTEFGIDSTKLADFLRSEQGVNTQLTEGGGNFFGGQRQRLALARAILHDSPIYIFDEATSNIDVESENDIMEQIHALARIKTVLLISHCLVNAGNADRIYL